MPLVTYRARGSDGAEVRGNMRAETLEDAQAELERRGLRDVVFATDPIFPDLDDWGADERPPAPDLGGPWRTIAASFAMTAPVVLCAASVGWSLSSGELAPWVAGAVIALGIAAWIVTAAPVALFARVQLDKAWGRWRDVLRGVALLRACNALVRLKAMRWAYDFEEARALAGLGRVDDAIAVVSKHRGSGPLERGRHAGLLVGIYENAGRYDDALLCAEEHARECSSDAGAWLDLAMRHALRFHDPARAREALARADGMIRSEVAVPFEAVVRAIVLLEEGAYAAALEAFDAARDGVARTARHSPGFLPLFQLHRAWALAGTGKIDEAASELRAARPMLLATVSGRDILAHVTSRVRPLVAIAS